MAALRTSLVKRDHAWTGADVPWRLDMEGAPSAGASEAERARWRLFHYLSGGGMRALGRSVAQEETDRKRNRFLIASGVFAAVWLALLVL